MPASTAYKFSSVMLIDDNDIELLKGSATMPTILPGAQLFLQLPHPPVRKMIDAGLPLAIASDYNPGSSPTGSVCASRRGSPPPPPGAPIPRAASSCPRRAAP